MHLFREEAAQDMDAALAQLPIIDLGPHLNGEPGALEALAADIKDACERIGFFLIKNHGVPDGLIADTFAQSKRFHALPLETKTALSLDENNIGYMPMNASMQAHSTVHKATTPNQNESFFVTHDRGPDHPDVIKKKPLRGQNNWPGDLPDFREGVMKYFAAVNALGQSLVQPFSVALGMPADYLDDHFSDENNATLRMLHYPPTEMTGNDFGTAPHTDNSFMTILGRMDVPGLAIRLPSGEWLPPPLIPGTYLVNIGNMLRRMSNDRFLSTPHGVIVDGKVDRYSLAYFHSPNPYRMIEVVPSCLDGDNPPKYEPRLYADLMHEFYAANYFHQKDHGTIEMKNQYD
ncbi:MAG: isopenicillin N synthase family oxygenase [Rhodospirillaceae bacterium]|jgi:isopenicillin N synthase-like dioxygenase|nr:isopenicillin N synthase family oxygenase [Rhodospirillaceae bacterium]MBT4487159.1 isopenicillin N synthase family oxygenase [Rhodospirillaceae bacterium]MBT5190711.1 isopenicillin N synthase family oxygenase [Rhodospirillaceae bacterium]MBT5898074.1 isopenicillin N synthase family oxygenase [Rhodospirillaceae bacterium]MBT6430287.1 isopenicillin N synthase family oxygenase [Rhodospirillaceae bacterium]